MTSSAPKNESFRDGIWNWSTDPSGRITAVSSLFSTTLGAAASNSIIGKTFWGFCDNLDAPNAAWKELAVAMREQKRIRKFVFSYNAQGDFIKLKIHGEPVFSKGKWVGYQGKGQICGEDELTTHELSENSMNMSLEALDIGIGYFDVEGTLKDYNDKFVRHLSPTGVDISRNMTMSTILIHLKAKNPNLISFNDKNKKDKETLIVSIRDEKSLLIRVGQLDHGGFTIKTEQVQYIVSELRSGQEQLQRLQDENTALSHRLEDYRYKLDTAIRNKSDNRKSGDANEVEKLFTFYENQLNVGILITDLKGVPINLNYAASEIFNFRTAKDFLASVENITKLKGYDPSRNEIVANMLTGSQSRMERDIEIITKHGLTPVKEVITIFPSVVRPEKVISFLYEHKGDIYQQIEQTKPEKDDTESEEAEILTKTFFEYVLNNIKTSIQVISGYSDLALLEKDEKVDTENIGYIHQSCATILNRITDVANLHNAISDIDSFDQNLFHPEDIVNSIYTMLHKEVLRKGIDISIEMPDDGLSIICDQKIFQSALYKIMSNAVAISEGCGNIILRVNSDHLERKLSISISDESGINIENIMEKSKNYNDNIPISSHDILFNIKIASILLKKMGISVEINSYTNLGNTININIPTEMLVSTNASPDDIAV
ncbi:MAG: hypothetical protein AAF621_07880 [Pseudomonadota bacterium]